MTPAAFALVVDGRPLPALRALVDGGRALVPVRVLAGALAADISYDAATRTVRVRRASRTATVPGVRFAAGRAYAPLRAAADALGVGVRYDASRRRIALAGVSRVASDTVRAVGASAPTPDARAAPSAPALPVTVTSETPASGAAVDTPFPTLSARLVARGAAVDPASVRMTLDGVPLVAALIGDTLTATPRATVTAGTHTVSVEGSDLAGTRFSETWSFVETGRVSTAVAPIAGALDGVWLDRRPAPGERRFDVLASGAPGTSGYVTIDGLPGAFPLVATGGSGYVAHVLLPGNLDVPYAQVRLHLTPALAAPFVYTLPAPLRLTTNAPTPLPLVTPVSGAPRHLLGSPSPAPSPRPRARASPRSSVPS